jgi:OPA family glycerol-3-phosphate transporter-like MFS transporter
VYLLVRLRDTPQSVGLPPIEQFQHEQSGAVNGECEEELGTRDLLVNYILKNRYLWIFAGANFFAYIARYSMLDWGPTYLKEVKHASLAQGGFGTATLEFSAMFSTILVGWVSDKVGGSRGRICAICMIPVLLSFICILYSSDTSLWLDIGLFGVIGFFVYPAVMLLGICALDCSSKKAVGTANGFISIFGSLGRMVEGKGIGVLVERYGWNTALRGIMISTLLGIALLSLTWKLSPHNAKAGKAKKQNVPVEV